MVAAIQKPEGTNLGAHGLGRHRDHQPQDVFNVPVRCDRLADPGEGLDMFLKSVVVLHGLNRKSERIPRPPEADCRDL